MLKQVTNYLESVGLWIPENKPKYDFFVSPEVFTVKDEHLIELERFTPKLREFFQNKTGSYPYFCKVDVMIDTNEKLRIAEIDGLNKRALGYAILERKIAEMFGHNTSLFFYGIENALKNVIGSKKLFIIVPGKEKYYQYGFNILVEELCKIGVNAAWGHEKASVKFLRETNPNDVVLLDSPRTGHEVLDAILSNTDWNILIPNHEIFSSKKNLAMFEDSLIPRTVDLRSLIQMPFENYVIKQASRSGSKGVYFGDEIQIDEFIVQEFVKGKEHSFEYFDKSSTLVKTDGWQVRLIVTLNLNNGTVTDVDVTACQSKLVHGSSECIQIPGICMQK